MGADLVEALAGAFRALFGRDPDAAERERLAWIAPSTAGLTPLARQRRVLGAFDQQVVATAVSIRWGPEDLQQVDVDGLKVSLDAADVSVSGPIAAGVYEPHVLAFFRRTLQPGMTFVDAGANVGLYSLLASRLVGPQGCVMSFEPNSENCRLLLASAAANGLRNIALHPLALGAARGYTQFTSALGSNGQLLEGSGDAVLQPTCRIVPIAPLDDFALPALHVLKTDVEGAEGLVFDGARATIARCRPVVVTEFSHEMLTRISRRPGAQYLAGFTALGYRVALLVRETGEEVAIEDPAAFAAEFVGTGRIEDLVLRPA